MQSFVEVVIPLFAIVVLGYGRMGHAVVEVLRARGVAFSVVDLDPERCRALEKEHQPAVRGDATQEEVFRTAVRLARELERGVDFEVDEPERRARLRPPGAAACLRECDRQFYPWNTLPRRRRSW